MILLDVQDNFVYHGDKPDRLADIRNVIATQRSVVRSNIKITSRGPSERDLVHNGF